MFNRCDTFAVPLDGCRSKDERIFSGEKSKSEFRFGIRISAECSCCGIVISSILANRSGVVATDIGKSRLSKQKFKRP